MIERRQDRLSRALLARVPNLIPAGEVPEDLIEEAMAVLQGKSRDVVIRELQRTVSLLVYLIHISVCLGSGPALTNPDKHVFVIHV